MSYGIPNEAMGYKPWGWDMYMMTMTSSCFSPCQNLNFQKIPNTSFLWRSYGVSVINAVECHYNMVKHNFIHQALAEAEYENEDFEHTKYTWHLTNR